MSTPPSPAMARQSDSASTVSWFLRKFLKTHIRTSEACFLHSSQALATQVELSIAQSVAAAYYPGADKCESTALPLYLWRGRGILSRRG